MVWVRGFESAVYTDRIEFQFAEHSPKEDALEPISAASLENLSVVSRRRLRFLNARVRAFEILSLSYSSSC
ncbi:hypothetical protein HYG81_18680 [Natrinema zhouii]|uniref:hypothetical protein n=1 Tax=Natrinema zhouii TaxID=1710539 RepID=UPI001CFFFC96|nr:hypothetical protein [Natrinema zhouii]UHQ97960.1 hypothetical protein HYG81_18680 [Natrinema zhouii]